MSTTLPATPTGSALPASVLNLLETLEDRQQQLLEASKAENTWAGYRSDWRSFAAWCTDQGYPVPADPETITEPPPVELLRAYLMVESVRLSPATLSRRLSAIKFWCHLAGYPSPTDHPTISGRTGVLRGITRERKQIPRRAAPLYLSEIATAAASFGEDPAGIRNRAILLAGWWGAFRRSELVGIDKAHLADHPEGIVVTLPTSKTDQAGEGRQVPLHYRDDEAVCPVRAVRAWMALTDSDDDALFVRVGKWGDIRQGQRVGARTVNQVVKAAAETLGLDPDRYSAHSLRAGFVSECDRRRVPTAAVRAVTGHTTEAMLSSYARPGSLFDNSAGAYFGEDPATADNDR